MIPRAHLAVAGAAVLFGSTFVVVKDALDGAEVTALLAARFSLAAVALAPVALLRRPRTEGWLRDGLLCGIALLAGYAFQTAGLRSTTTTVSAFLTYLLVVIVPVLSAVVLRRPPSRDVSAGVALATGGLLLLTGGVRTIGRGELLTIGCAVSFAVHVLLVAEASRRHDFVRLLFVQLAFVGVACSVTSLTVNGGVGLTGKAWVAAAYLGAVSIAAFGLQIWGQARVSPTRASLLLMLEPVVAAVVGFAIGERLGGRGLLGGALILAGIFVAERRVQSLTERSTP